MKITDFMLSTSKYQSTVILTSSIPKCCCSDVQSYLTLFGPMCLEDSTPGFPVLHYLLKFAQTHVHWLTMPFNHLILCIPFLLLPSTFPSFRVFYNKPTLRQVAKVLEFQGPSRSSITVQKHQFFGVQRSLCSRSHIHTRLLEKT